MTGPITSTVTDTALVLEGGGMRGSYTAGAVTTLLQAGIYLDHVSGISAGASHLCNYLSRDLLRTRRSFVEFAEDPRFGDMRTFLRGKGMFNAQYIYEESSLPDQALPFDWETFAANPARLRVGALRCDTGEPVWWSREDTPTMQDLLVRVRASSTMPVVMPITTVDGARYVDGALGPSGGIPLEAAEMDGYDRFLVILSRERGYLKKPVRQTGFYRRYFRRYPAVADALLARWRHYNETRERLWELEREGRAMVFVPDRMPVGNGERRVARLRQSYEMGLAQARRELPAWREFLGVPA